MSKVVSQMSEQMKSKIRNIRQDGMKQLKQDAKSAPADEIKKLEKLVMEGMIHGAKCICLYNEFRFKQ